MLKINRALSKKHLIWGFLFFSLGCSSVHHYKTLSFFFDGVPVPEQTSVGKDSLAPKDTLKLQNKSAKAEELRYYHAPFQSNNCNVCHDQQQMGKLNNRMPDLCFQCHEDFSKKYKALHAPLLGGYCTSCHNPHTAMNPKLLNFTGQSLCTQCHEMTQVLKNPVHLGILETNCTECHNPHGGDDHNVLK